MRKPKNLALRIARRRSVADRAQPHGQHIFAYCHIRTNQVLYSLHRQLADRDFKQLPDVGANNTPDKWRKDLWRPLYTVTLPPTASGPRQGLDAYKSLIEWKKLHEHYWEPSSMMKRPYSELEKEKFQTRLDNRGGSKVEGVHDLITREKWKMRVATVMNQKANSIADLAAVLLTLEKRSYLNSKARQQKLEMVRLADEAANGGTEKLEKLIRQKEDMLEAIAQDMAVPKQADAKFEENKMQNSADEAKRRKLEVLNMIRLAKRGGLEEIQKRETSYKEKEEKLGELSGYEHSAMKIAILQNQRKIDAIRFAAEAVATAKARAESSARTKDGRKPDFQEYLPSFTSDPTTRQGPRVKKLCKSIQSLRERLEEMRSAVRAVAAAKAQVENEEGRAKDRGRIVAEGNTSNLDSDPAFWTFLPTVQNDPNPENEAGVVVHWQNPLDPEYAEMWPSSVEHKPMTDGKSFKARHLAPLPPVQGSYSPKEWMTPEQWTAAKQRMKQPTFTMGSQTKVRLHRAVTKPIPRSPTKAKSQAPNEESGRIFKEVLGKLYEKTRTGTSPYQRRELETALHQSGLTEPKSATA